MRIDSTINRVVYVFQQYENNKTDKPSEKNNSKNNEQSKIHYSKKVVPMIFE